MKYSALFFVLIFLSCENKKTVGPLSEQKSNRKIKLIRESTHDPFVKNRRVEYRTKISDNTFIRSSMFNKDGKIIKESWFNSKGNLQSKVIHKYNRVGTLLESDFYDQNESVVGKKINSYNSSNRLLSGNETDANGQLLAKETASFDSEGNRIVESYRLLHHTLTKMQESVFDKHENNIENIYFDNGTLVRKEINTYDSLNNIIKTVVFFAWQNEQDVIHYKYDNQNNNVEEVFTKNNLMISKTVSRFDKNNNEVETLTYGVRGNLQKSQKLQYLYDDANQWTRKISIINGKPASVILREIEYY